VQQAAEAGLAAPTGVEVEVLRDNPRRRVLRVRRPGGESLLVKQFRTATGKHPVRERLKRLLGLSGARREWRMLHRLRTAGVSVPEPLAFGTLRDGDPVLVMRYVDAPPLREADLGRGAARRRALHAIGELVRGLHRAGYVHNDLHPDNLLVAPDGPLLVDLQHARRSRTVWARRRDLGGLDFGLTGLASTAERLRVSSVALGLARPFRGSARRRLRSVPNAARAHAETHARSRTRRSLRPGRRYARVELSGLRGLRLRSFDESATRATAHAVAAHREALARTDARVVKHDTRSRITGFEAGGQAVVVKEVLPRGLRRIVADRFRGSPARRAWRAGHGLEARGIGTATPLAFLERRRFGFPVESLVVLRSLAPARPADALAGEPKRAQSLALALSRFVVALHARGIDHGDLKASHVFLVERGPEFQPALIDLEGVRFRGRLSRARRMQALVELNASLPDAFPAEARCAAFERYARALPFPGGERRALLAIVRRSLERRHRWSGAGCDAALRLARG
jgi:tRNA A-37 threonylcarbamoyl transferase component Bud32